MTDDPEITPDGYVIVPARKPVIRGQQCGECGMKFDYNKAYGYVCPNPHCPMQPKPCSLAQFDRLDRP